MIRYKTRLGNVTISDEYFANIIGNAVVSCYGVASMVAKGTQKVRSVFSKDELIDKGIIVRGNIDKINVSLYITVMFGVNINAISQSIVHKVKYTVREATGIEVDKVTVHIDGMQND